MNYPPRTADTPNNNVVIHTVKAAYDRPEDAVVRFYEAAGEDGDIELKLNYPIRKAYEADMLERLGNELNCDGHSVIVPTRAYEIKTGVLSLENQTVGQKP